MLSETMLQTKLYIPPIRPLLVPRPHLVEKLNACLTCKLTLVSAPPGFGKTTLVTSWIDQVSDEQLPGIGWLSLDSEDNDPARFLTYLIAAMRQALDDPQFGDIVLNAFSSPQPLPLPSILTLLLNGLTAVSLPILLILDDYHEIEAE
ncbi:MAG: hypothetical protein GY943_15505, partial [Chloroflexi bacterium]|nr:hypothetical protein [Chloroflexota bacterium]